METLDTRFELNGSGITLETLDTRFELKEVELTLDGNSSAGKGSRPPRSESTKSFGPYD